MLPRGNWQQLETISTEKAEISDVLQEYQGEAWITLCSQKQRVFFKNTLPLHQACLAFRDIWILEIISFLYRNSKFLVVSSVF